MAVVATIRKRVLSCARALDNCARALEYYRRDISAKVTLGRDKCNGSERVNNLIIGQLDYAVDSPSLSKPL